MSKQITLPYDIHPTNTDHKDMVDKRVTSIYDGVKGTVVLAIPAPIHARCPEGRELDTCLLIRWEDGTYYWCPTNLVSFDEDRDDHGPPEISGHEGEPHSWLSQPH
jgi:hypothetical protein